MKAGVAVLTLLIAAAACFSDRAGPVAFAGDPDCALALDSTTIGAVAVVVIREFSFQPAEVRVRPGTRITWLNCEEAGGGGVSHTSTADEGAWDSPLLARGERFSTVLGSAGSYGYHCAPHPSMRGRIIVE